MSSISSIGGGSGLYQFVQNLSATTSSQPADPTTQVAGTSTTDGTSGGQQVQGSHHHHRHGHGGSDNSQLFQQVQQAVTSALQSASQNGTNPNQAVEDAITKVFQNNNSAQQQQTPASTTNPGDPTAAGSTTTGTPASTGNSALQAFFQTLQNAGIDPQQFHQDFLTAAQNAQNGDVNAGTAFQSVPTGSIIDAYG